MRIREDEIIGGSLYLYELVLRATQHLQEPHGTPALAGEIRTTVVAHRHRHTTSRAGAQRTDLWMIDRRIGGDEAGRGGPAGPIWGRIPGKVQRETPSFFLPLAAHFYRSPRARQLFFFLDSFQASVFLLVNSISCILARSAFI